MHSPIIIIIITYIDTADDYKRRYKAELGSSFFRIFPHHKILRRAYHKFININYYPFVRALVIDATHVNRRVGAMQPYAEK